MPIIALIKFFFFFFPGLELISSWLIAFLTMWYTGRCWLFLLVAAFVRASDRNTGWCSHIDHPEEINHRDSDILKKSRDKWATITELNKYCIFLILDVVCMAFLKIKLQFMCLTDYTCRSAVALEAQMWACGRTKLYLPSLTVGLCDQYHSIHAAWT